MELRVLSILLLITLCHGKLESNTPKKATTNEPKVPTGGCGAVTCPGERKGDQKPKPQSCVDHLKNGARNCGFYKIYDAAGNGLTVYCDMQTEPGAAWTLIMSWSLAQKDLLNFKSAPLKISAPVNENSPNWFLYRLTADRMKSLRAVSTHWRATCSFDKYGINQYRDYVRGSFAEADIFTFIGAGQCLKTELVNIRGIIGIHKKVRFWQVLNSYMAHIDSSVKGCSFDSSATSVGSEDNFGYYGTINPKFTCTESDKSTTQWWFGSYE